MAPSMYDQITREHPAYVAGFAQGRDVGLTIALNVICRESARQEDAAIHAALGTDSSAAMPHEYAAGRLLLVGRIVAATFRTVQSD